MLHRVCKEARGGLAEEWQEYGHAASLVTGAVACSRLLAQTTDMHLSVVRRAFGCLNELLSNPLTRHLCCFVFSPYCLSQLCHPRACTWCAQPAEWTHQVRQTDTAQHSATQHDQSSPSRPSCRAVAQQQHNCVLAHTAEAAATKATAANAVV